MKLYKLYVAKPLLVYYLAMLGLFVLVGIVGLGASTAGKFGADAPPAWVFVIVLVFAVFTAYMWLRYPFEIRIRDDSAVEFRSVFRRTTISPSDIQLVRAKRYAIGFVDVIHGGGKIHLLNHMDGFHDFIATLKSLNPSIKIQGC